MIKFTSHQIKAITLKKIITSLFFSIIIFSNTSIAGGWLSGGGDNVQDGLNPWFLSNKKDIKYCVSFSTEEISGSEEIFDESITYSIKEWRRNFTTYYKNSTEENKISVGLNEWHKVNCDQVHDIKFAIGWNSLSAEEKKYLSQNNRKLFHIGEAVRTSYVPTDLSGKGFIFIGSDIGNNAFLLTKNQIERPWRYKGLITLIILHELGHVFGVPHLSSAIFPYSSSTIKWLMSSRFPEMILDKFYSSNLSKVNELPEININLFDPEFYKTCGNKQVFKKVLNIKSDYECLFFKINRIKNYSLISEIDVYGAQNENQKKTYLTRIIPDDFKQVEESLITIFLPPNNKVISNSEAPENHLMNGPGLISANGSMLVRNSGQVERKINAVLFDGSLKIYFNDRLSGEALQIEAN